MNENSCGAARNRWWCCRPKERQEGDEWNVIYKLLHYSIRFIIKVSILSSRFGRGRSCGLFASIPSDWVEKRTQYIIGFSFEKCCFSFRSPLALCYTLENSADDEWIGFPRNGRGWRAKKLRWKWKKTYKRMTMYINFKIMCIFRIYLCMYYGKATATCMRCKLRFIVLKFQTEITIVRRMKPSRTLANQTTIHIGRQHSPPDPTTARAAQQSRGGQSTPEPELSASQCIQSLTQCMGHKIRDTISYSEAIRITDLWYK